MNLPAVVILAYLALGLELGLRPALAVGGGVAPSVLFPLLVYICLFAPTRQALWSALAFGVAADLVSPWTTPGGGRQLVVVGPGALGYAAGAYLTLTVRALVIRRNPLTLAVLSVIAMALAGVVSVFLLSLRSLYDPHLAIQPAPELVRRTLSALYTGLSAGLMGVVLVPLAGPLGFAERKR
ncbi:MAG TPA: hypothetical protein VD963_09360 [Phycisphaerales bacterium]|nr:hypothetical protein [Phycisphaerales bacterium]